MAATSNYFQNLFILNVHLVVRFSKFFLKMTCFQIGFNFLCLFCQNDIVSSIGILVQQSSTSQLASFSSSHFSIYFNINRKSWVLVKTGLFLQLVLDIIQQVFYFCSKMSLFDQIYTKYKRTQYLKHMFKTYFGFHIRRHFLFIQIIKREKLHLEAYVEE